MAGGGKSKSFISISGINAWVHKTLDTYGLVDAAAILAVVAVIYLGFRDPATLFQAGAFLLALIPLTAPFLLWHMWEHSWMEYIREDKFWNGREYVVLEVRLPEDLMQSPYAMELVLRSMYDIGGIDTPADEYWRGHTTPWYSLEIVSTEGVVRFYIWTWKQFKNFIETQIYAHYPSVQVYEVPDYTLMVPFDAYHESEYDVWGIEQQLQLPDPYPISTYVNAGLDKKDLKEEFKSDPLNSLLEFFSTMKAGEHAWMQVIIRGHTVCPYAADKYGHALSITDWIALERAEKLKNTMIDEKDKPNFSRLSYGEQEAIKAMELKPYKQMYDVGIRSVYLYRKSDSTLGKKKAGFPTTMRAFEHGSAKRGLNGFKPIFPIGLTYKWQDPFGSRVRRQKKEHYEAYIARQYFFAPHDRKWIALNVEEIASIYHFPGRVAGTPTLQRMPSKRGDAPPNLPTGN